MHHVTNVLNFLNEYEQNDSVLYDIVQLNYSINNNEMLNQIRVTLETLLKISMNSLYSETFLIFNLT